MRNPEEERDNVRAAIICHIPVLLIEAGACYPSEGDGPLLTLAQFLIAYVTGWIATLAIEHYDHKRNVRNKAAAPTYNYGFLLAVAHLFLFFLIGTPCAMLLGRLIGF